MKRERESQAPSDPFITTSVTFDKDPAQVDVNALSRRSSDDDRVVKSEIDDLTPAVELLPPR